MEDQKMGMFERGSESAAKELAIGIEHSVTQPLTVLRAERPLGIVSIGTLCRCPGNLLRQRLGKARADVASRQALDIEGADFRFPMQPRDEDGKGEALFEADAAEFVRLEQGQIALLRVLPGLRALSAKPIQAGTRRDTRQPVNDIWYG